MIEKELVRQFLLAWHDSITYSNELVPVLARTLGTEPQNIYYQRGLSPTFQHSGTLQETKWRYFFHGISSCDLEQVEDGRFVQLSFGPHSRIDTFLSWGAMLFIMASKPPWPNYMQLKQHLAGKPPPYNYLSGSHHKMLKLTKPIEKLGLFEVADKGLTRQKIELRERYSYVDDEGRSIFTPPSPYNDPKSRLFWDLQVCDTWVLSEQGKKLFADNLNINHFSELWGEKVIGGKHRAG